jgi:hypothetical protein
MIFDETTICEGCKKPVCQCDKKCPCEKTYEDCEWPSSVCPCPICDELMSNCECNITIKDE